MDTIVKTGGGVPISDYEALQAQLSSLQNSYNSLSSEYSSYKNSHAHTNEEYDAHDIVHSKTIVIWCRWYGGGRGHELIVDGKVIGYTGPDETSNRTVHYTVTI